VSSWKTSAIASLATKSEFEPIVRRTPLKPGSHVN